ncbi:SPFH domain-containing protein [Microvirga lotononidis]|uniref:Uncharacterized protein n=1 Tax=Microvirga lotononidis TaxID=864069 RepID=I4YKZ5_9HYPH|nr:hypothetical protein [Microvirga lotononidis]EIM24637.1 hypothetical protein MicloDRAFT_00053520 [Microvirga lotononidis]WQO26651.1 hypothetical protein U0023_18520 [Microvirga lotononidis]
MSGFPARIFGALGCFLALSVALPAQADPFFVKVYGRTYKIDPRYPSDEKNGPKPQDAMKDLPADLARGPAIRPSHEEVLAEVEERLWIASNQLDAKLENAVKSRDRRNAASDTKAAKQDITDSLASGTGPGRTPELQTLYDRYRALNLLARELRRSLDLPVKTPDSGFSRPKLTPEIEASYRSQKFDPYAAYYGFRRVKAAFRSGDVELIARVTDYPLSITGKIRRTLRNRDQVLAAKETILNAAIRDAVAKSTFESVFVRDKGMMVGGGAVWITPDKASFGLGTVNLD